MEPLLTPGDVAEILGIDPATVRRKLAGGEIPGCKLGHRTWRVRPEDLRQYVASKRGAPDA